MEIALTGDVMLGRLVDLHVIQHPKAKPTDIWGDVLPLLKSAGLRLINLECVVAEKGEQWRPLQKVFHFRAHRRALDFLKAADIDCVTLANNHVLDYGTEALGECLELLDEAGIQRAGAGLDLQQALEPARFDTSAGRVSVIALTDNEPEWEAAVDKPGVNFIAYTNEGLIEPYKSRISSQIEIARKSCEVLIASAHVGANWGAPTGPMQVVAHQLIDFGVDIYWGHSNHTPQGIEVYKSRFIIYSSGDFVDDYAVDPFDRNDLSFLYLLDVDKGKIGAVTMFPTAIQDFAARRAHESEAAFLQDRLAQQCAMFGTEVERTAEYSRISV